MNKLKVLGHGAKKKISRCAFLFGSAYMTLTSGTTAFADDDTFGYTNPDADSSSDLADTLNTAFGTVQAFIMGISTAVAALCAVICLFIMLFSKNTRNVEEAMQWLKRIVICWVAIMAINMIVKFFTNTIYPTLSNSSSS